MISFTLSQKLLYTGLTRALLPHLCSLTLFHYCYKTSFKEKPVLGTCVVNLYDTIPCYTNCCNTQFFTQINLVLFELLSESHQSGFWFDSVHIGEIVQGSHSKTARVMQPNLKKKTLNLLYFLFEFDQEERQDGCSFLSSHVQSLFFLFLTSSLSVIISFLLRPLTPLSLSFPHVY